MTQDKNNNNDKKWPYRALTPLDNCEGLENYFEMLDFALADKDVRNIGLMGSYGSGKSSILESYIKERKLRDTTVTVSLATFNLNGKGEVANDDERSIEAIELSLIQQIIYHASPEELPDSKLERIKQHKKRSFTGDFKRFFLIGLNVFIGGFILLTALGDDVSWKQWITVGVALWGLLGFWYLIRGSFGFRNIKKLSFMQISAELEHSKNEKGRSLLNEHIDELIYFFREKRDYRLVLLEDLDRLEHVQVIPRLREINKIINTALKISKEGSYKPLKFIFAVRDDLFKKPKERIKFFDFIVPVNIAGNAASSKPTLLQELEEIPLFADFISDDYGFIYGLSVWLYDRRMILNVLNEFKLYHQSITGIKELSPNHNPMKLLALISYKNVLTNDYVLYQMGRGYLYTIMRDYENGDLARKLTEVGAELCEIDKNLKNISFFLKFRESETPYMQDDYRQAASAEEEFHEEGNRLTKLIKIRTLMDILDEPDDLYKTLNEAYGEDLGKLTRDQFTFLVFLLRSGFVEQDYSLYLNVINGADAISNDDIFLQNYFLGETITDIYNFKLEDITRVLEVLGEKPVISEALLNKYLFKGLLQYNSTTLEWITDSFMKSKDKSLVYKYATFLMRFIEDEFPKFKHKNNGDFEGIDYSLRQFVRRFGVMFLANPNKFDEGMLLQISKFLNQYGLKN